jgi:hypothetical protein
VKTVDGKEQNGIQINERGLCCAARVSFTHATDEEPTITISITHKAPIKSTKR